MFDNNDDSRLFEHIEDLQRTDFIESNDFDWFDFRTQIMKKRTVKGTRFLFQVLLKQIQYARSKKLLVLSADWLQYTVTSC